MTITSVFGWNLLTYCNYCTIVTLQSPTCVFHPCAEEHCWCLPVPAWQQLLMFSPVDWSAPVLTSPSLELLIVWRWGSGVATMDGMSPSAKAEKMQRHLSSYSVSLRLSAYQQQRIPTTFRFFLKRLKLFLLFCPKQQNRNQC